MIPFLFLLSPVLNCNFIYYFFLFGKEIKTTTTTRASNTGYGFVEKEITDSNFQSKISNSCYGTVIWKKNEQILSGICSCVVLC